MIEILKSRISLDFLLKLVNRAGGLDGFDGTAVRANEIVAMLSGDEESEIGRPFMETKTADHSFIIEALEKTKHGGLITLL